MPYSVSDLPNVGDRVRAIHDSVDGTHSWPPIGSEGVVFFLDVGDDEAIQVDFSEHPGCPSSRGCHWWSRLDRLEPAVPHTFYLVEVIQGKPVRHGHATFPDGKAAADYAKAISVTLGRKIQPRPIAADSASSGWRTREKDRFTDGTYQAMPKAWNLTPIPDHFVHPSRDEEGKLSFTETPAMGVIDRQIRLAPGRYLARFYPHLSDQERKRYIAMVDKGEGLQIARTPDEIERVYRNGPNSCMSKPIGHYDSFVHPVRAYGNSDLAVAYLQRDGRINARAVVWPDKKIFGRLYGDEHRLKVALEDDGYVGFDYDDTETGFEGAKIAKIWDAEKEFYVCPYFDTHSRAIDPDITSREGFFILDAPHTHRDIAADTLFIQFQTGDAMGARYCPKLKVFTHDYDFALMHGEIEAWSLEALRANGIQVRTDLGDNRWYPDAMVVYIEGDGYRLKSRVDLSQYFISAANPKMVRSIDKYSHLSNRVELEDGRFITQNEFRYETYICAGSGKRFLKNEDYPIYLNSKSYSRAWLEQRSAELGCSIAELRNDLRCGITSRAA